MIPEKYSWLNSVGVLPRILQEGLKLLGTVETPSSAAKPPDWLRRGPVGQPTARVNAAMQGVVVNAEPLGGFCNRHLLAEERVDCARTSIAALCFKIGPSAIIKRVWAIVIAAIKRHSLRALAHVAKKSSEAVPPFITNSDSPPAVVRVFLAVCRVAAPFHFRPTTHGRAVSKSVDPVLLAANCNQFSMETPAATRLSAGDVTSLNALLSAAFATTKRAFSNSFKNSPSIHADTMTWDKVSV